jgi:hypothetical protein
VIRQGPCDGPEKPCHKPNFSGLKVPQAPQKVSCGIFNSSGDVSNLRGATVHEEFYSIYEARIAGCEEQGGGGDLFGTAHLASRDQAL